MHWSWPKAIRIFLLAVIPGLLVIPSRIMAENVDLSRPFRSIELRGGGEVILRHASFHRVRLVEASTRWTSVRVDEDRLEIERCRDDCPRGYKLRVEVFAPEIHAAAVSDGGAIVAGSFPPQKDLAIAVDNGGLLDFRSMRADEVKAAVQQGGRILTKPKRHLVAAVSHGGVVTYWGNPSVRSVVDDGGRVSRGKRADADKAAEMFDPEPPPPVPPVPPVAPNGSNGID